MNCENKYDPRNFPGRRFLKVAYTICGVAMIVIGLAGVSGGNVLAVVVCGGASIFIGLAV